MTKQERADWRHAADARAKQASGMLMGQYYRLRDREREAHTHTGLMLGILGTSREGYIERDLVRQAAQAGDTECMRAITEYDDAKLDAEAAWDAQA